MIKEEIVRKFNKTLKEKDLTIFCGESITAGLLASTIASVSGASSVLKGGIVTYNKDVKINILNVSPKTLEIHTAESQETTNEMCYGLKEIYPCASIYVAVTGVASEPTTSYEVGAKVGQIYVSILYYKTFYQFDHFIDSKDCQNPRTEIREKTVEYIFTKIEEIIS